MKRALFLRYLPQRIQRRLRAEIRTRILPLPIIAYLWLINRFARAPVISGEGPVVSLTSYGKRLRTVYLTIESIARGRRLPSRLILWIDNPVLFGNLPLPLHRLMKRGLEVRLCKNYGPHKKYYPYVESQAVFTGPLATADDDMFYPRSWLSGLLAANKEFPNCVNCYRARDLTLQNGNIAPYRQWPLCESADPRYRVVATGEAGVIYPSEFLRQLKAAGSAFQTCCPKADDLWLHVQAIRAKFLVRQVTNKPRNFLMIPRTQAVALALDNWEGGGNDRQIAATYVPEDIRQLIEDTAFHISTPTSFPYTEFDRPESCRL
jgi:hypothetical protein